CFIDDIVVFSQTADEHVTHLRNVLSLFRDLRITLLLKKSFLAYPSVKLLGYQVDRFRIATTAERVVSIKNLKFPKNLRALEQYLRITGYLR
ncbi:hypothetical protein M430DRAFT_97354, partial [Amorphotheca resinae ATCC 22711]